jgi:hypothetical protein
MIESNSAPPSYSNFQPWPGKIYSGFSNSYAWLNHYYGKINQAVTKKGEEAVEIAQKPRAGTTQWLCAMEDQDFLYLQTAERKGTPALDVGCLVLVDAGSEEKIATIMLLHIIRIERIQNNILNVLAKKIGQQSTNILFKNTTAGKSPGIISCYNEQRFLLANATEHFKSGETIEVQLPDQTSATIKIKEINSISQQFQALELE